MLDYRAQIETALWTLMEADAGFTGLILAGNRAKMNTNTGWLRDRAGRNLNDWPIVKIEHRPTSQPTPPPRTFAMGTGFTYATVDMGIPLSHQIALSIVYASNARSNQQTPIEAAIERVLWNAWPTLGLAYVTGFTQATARTERTEAGGAKHPVSTITLTFSLRPRLSQLASA